MFLYLSGLFFFWVCWGFVFKKRNSILLYRKSKNMIKNLFESATGLPVEMVVEEKVAKVTIGIGVRFEIDVSDLTEDEYESMVLLKALFVSMREWHDSLVPCDEMLDKTIDRLSSLVLLKEEVTTKGSTMKYVIDELNKKYVEV